MNLTEDKAPRLEWSQMIPLLSPKRDKKRRWFRLGQFSDLSWFIEVILTGFVISRSKLNHIVSCHLFVNSTIGAIKVSCQVFL